MSGRAEVGTWKWDPDKYLAFSKNRARPFIDLLHRIDAEPKKIVDLGCGPGHLTALMRAKWPTAHIIGIDSSPDMIGWAQRENSDPRVSYELADIVDWHGEADLIISNAALHLVADQSIVERLAEAAPFFAFQVPNNFSAPSHTLLRNIAAREPYASHTGSDLFSRGTDAQSYLTALISPQRSVDAWETTYMHVLSGADPVFDWISGTGARPVIEALPEQLRDRFTAEYKAALPAAYPEREWGTLLPYKRVFVTCQTHNAVR